MRVLQVGVVAPHARPIPRVVIVAIANLPERLASLNDVNGRDHLGGRLDMSARKRGVGVAPYDPRPVLLGARSNPSLVRLVSRLGCELEGRWLLRLAAEPLGNPPYGAATTADGGATGTLWGPLGGEPDAPLGAAPLVPPAGAAGEAGALCPHAGATTRAGRKTPRNALHNFRFHEFLHCRGICRTASLLG